MTDRRESLLGERLRGAIVQRNLLDFHATALGEPRPVVLVCRGSGRCLIDSIVDYGHPSLPRYCPFCIVLPGDTRPKDVEAMAKREMRGQ